MSEDGPKKRGPKPKYEKLTGYQDGAPVLHTRIDPLALSWVKSQLEGTRPYLERIILEDKARFETSNPSEAAGQMRSVETREARP